MRHEEALAVASLVSFSIFGFNRGGKFIVPGTGFRIAPRLALTAKHVSDEIFRQLGLRENEPWPRQRRRYGDMEVRAAQQEIAGESNENTPWWWVDESFPSKLTDIAVLQLTPGNEAAAEADHRSRYLRWSLEPPCAEQRLWGFGYIEETRTIAVDDTKWNFEVCYVASVAPLRVERVLEQGRREEALDRPLFLTDPSTIDTGSMPCFEVEGTLEPSMSGGPVFNGDRVYGVISTGMSYEKNSSTVLKPYGTVALLEPLRKMGELALGNDSVTVAQLLTRGLIPSV